MEEFVSVALHHHRQYENGCAEVLIEEWARSTPARLSMLEKSNDDLPYNIALLQNNSLEESTSVTENHVPSRRVIGHSRLCRVHNQSHAAFVESVVICKDLRGLGLGRKLMLETERHAASLGIDTLYLTTHDKVDFYRHIGYDLCSPVVSLGSASRLLAGEKFANLLSKISIVETKDDTKLTRTNADTNENVARNDRSVDGNNTIGCINEQNSQYSAIPPLPPSLPPPPAPLLPPLAPLHPPVAPLPPPLPSCQPKASATGFNSIASVVPVWMKKSLK